MPSRSSIAVAKCFTVDEIRHDNHNAPPHLSMMHLMYSICPCRCENHSNGAFCFSRQIYYMYL